MDCFRNNAVKPSLGDREHGFSLIEVILALSVISMVIVGVLGGIASAFDAERSTGAEVQSRQLLDRMMEELQSVDFDGLLVFDGTFIVQADHRADLTVVQIEPNLMQIQVDVTSTVFPNVDNIGVLLIADPD